MSQRFLAALVALSCCIICCPAAANRSAFKPFTLKWLDEVKFAPTKRFHDWCKMEKETNVLKQPSRFSTFLHGKTVSAIIMHDDPIWVRYNVSDGNLSGGYLAEVLEEVARRTGFRWHNSTAVVQKPNSSRANESYDRWLAWASDNYDVVVGAFAGTADRRDQGFRFGFPLVDSSPELIGVVSVQEEDLFDRLFSWHRPFTGGVWLCIVIACVWTATIYYSIEQEHGDDFKKTQFRGSLVFEELEETRSTTCAEHAHRLFHSLMLTLLSFTGGGGFAPLMRCGKLFIFSWTFCVLMLCAAYTANLASFLIQENTESTLITGLDDAIRRKAGICVYKGGAFDNLLRDRYPGLHIVYPSKWDYDRVRDGTCAAMVKDAFYFKIDRGMKAKNEQCNLGIIGSPIQRVFSGFISKAGGGYCRELVMDVIDATMHNMYNDGWFERAEAKLIAGEQDHDCGPSAAKSSTDDDSALGFVHTGGMFLTHAVVTVICIVAHNLLMRSRHGEWSHQRISRRRNTDEAHRVWAQPTPADPDGENVVQTDPATQCLTGHDRGGP